MLKLGEQGWGEPIPRRRWSAGTCTVLLDSVRFYLKGDGKTGGDVSQRVTRAKVFCERLKTAHILCCTAH